MEIAASEMANGLQLLDRWEGSLSPVDASLLERHDDLVDAMVKQIVNDPQLNGQLTH
jgi:hypothetical protein